MPVAMPVPCASDRSSQVVEVRRIDSDSRTCERLRDAAALGRKVDTWRGLILGFTRGDAGCGGPGVPRTDGEEPVARLSDFALVLWKTSSGVDANGASRARRSALAPRGGRALWTIGNEIPGFRVRSSEVSKPPRASNRRR